MRQLFVPACVCLMTLSGSTGADPKPEPKLSLERFAGAPKRPAVAVALLPENETIVGEILDASAPAAASSVVQNEAPAPYTEWDRPAVAIEMPMAQTAAAPDDTARTPEMAPPLPKPKPEIKPVIYRSRAEICDTLAKAAQANNLPAPFFIRLLFQESGFHPAVVSRAGAQGIAQFMPETAADMGLDNPFDPLQAIPASARLLRSLFETFGNLGLAAAAYNAGPKRIQNWLAKKGVLPQETQGYVKIITGQPAEKWKGAGAGAPAVKLPRQAPCQEEAGLLAWNGPGQIPLPPSPRGTHKPARPVLVATAQRAAKSGENRKAGDKRDSAEKTQTADKIRTATKTKTGAGGKKVVQLAARKHKRIRLSQR